MESMTSLQLDNHETTSRGTPLKVLWFTTSPALSRSSLDGSYNVGTSWIEAMEGLVHRETDIELGIAFVWRQGDSLRKFRVDHSKSTYYALPRRPKGKWHNFLRSSLCLPEPSSAVEYYRKVVEDFKPDIINFFGTETPFPTVIPHIDIPHVIWFQGNLTVYHQQWHAGISRWQSLRAESFKDLLLARSDTHSFLQNSQFVKREKKIFGFAQNFIGRTAWDSRLVSTMAPQAQYHHCDEVMRDDFHRHKWRPHTGRGKMMITSTFRDNLYKGLEVAMSAYQLLKKTSPIPVQWNIVGVAEGSHYAKVCRFKSGLKKEDQNFRLAGSLPADKIISGMLEADLFVHPSHIDNSPNSLCEAMMLGLPIVSTNVGGIPTMLADEEEGLLVQNGDQFALAGAILDLIQHPHKAQQLGQAAMHRAHKRHDRKKIITQLVEVYNKIVKDNAANGVPITKQIIHNE